MINRSGSQAVGSAFSVQCLDYKQQAKEGWIDLIGQPAMVHIQQSADINERND
jgi:hypothetical protein